MRSGQYLCRPAGQPFLAASVGIVDAAAGAVECAGAEDTAEGAVECAGAVDAAAGAVECAGAVDAAAGAVECADAADANTIKASGDLTDAAVGGEPATAHVRRFCRRQASECTFVVGMIPMIAKYRHR